MPPENGLQGFINTFFQVESLKNQRELLALQQQNSLAQRTGMMADLAGLLTDPVARQNLSFMVGGEEALQAELIPILENLAPGVGVMERISGMRGFAQLPSQEQGELDEIAAARQTVGMTPTGVATDRFLGQLVGLSEDASDEELADLSRQYRSQLVGTDPGRLAQSVALADLPEADQTRIARIFGGIELSTMEQNQIAQWAAQNSINWASLEQNGALGMAELSGRLRIAEMSALSGSAANQGFTPTTVLTTMASSLDKVGDGTLSRAERAAHIQAFNGLADYLAANGLDVMPLRLDPDPENVSPGLWQGIKNFMFGTDNDGIEVAPPSPSSQLLQNQGQSQQEILLEFFRQQGLMP